MEDLAVGLRRTSAPFDLSFRTFMTRKEIQVLWTCFGNIESQIDPVFVANVLVTNGHITRELNKTIVHMAMRHEDRSTIIKNLLRQLTEAVSLQTLVKVLDECSYNEVAAKLLLALVKHQDEAERVSGVYKSTCGQRPMIHTFFRNLKRMVHDAQFQNPREALQNLADRFTAKMNMENDPVKKQIYADKCIAIIGAEIDAIAITFDTGLRNSQVFEQMRSLTNSSSNTMITDVVYYGRLANAQSIAGRFEDSENMLKAARSQAYHIGPCLELVNMLYIEVYVRLWMFEYTPTVELRKSLMMWGRVGIESLEEEDVDTKKLWRRMFILRMVFCLIGLGNRANIIPNCPICASDIAEAKLLLADIKQTFEGIETRRKMFYFVAKARIAELTKHKDYCIRKLHDAECLARQGHFEELEFIMKYLNRMVNLAGTEATCEQYVNLKTSSFENDFSGIQSTDHERVSAQNTFLKQMYQTECTSASPHSENNDMLHENTKQSRSVDKKEPKFENDNARQPSDEMWQPLSATIAEQTADFESKTATINQVQCFINEMCLQQQKRQPSPNVMSSNSDLTNATGIYRNWQQLTLYERDRLSGKSGGSSNDSALLTRDTDRSEFEIIERDINWESMTHNERFQNIQQTCATEAEQDDGAEANGPNIHDTAHGTEPLEDPQITVTSQANDILSNDWQVLTGSERPEISGESSFEEIGVPNRSSSLTTGHDVLLDLSSSLGERPTPEGQERSAEGLNNFDQVGVMFENRSGKLGILEDCSLRSEELFGD